MKNESGEIYHEWYILNNQRHNLRIQKETKGLTQGEEKAYTQIRRLVFRAIRPGNTVQQETLRRRIRTELKRLSGVKRRRSLRYEEKRFLEAIEPLSKKWK